MKNVTIVDIAQKTGLSLATVSRALNGQSNVKAETKEKVLKAARALGYQQNILAKQLNSLSDKNNAIKTIGMLIPDIRTPFYGRIFSSCAKYALEMGYMMSLSNSFNDLKLEHRFYDQMLAQHAYGVIQIGGSLDRENIPQTLFNQIRSAAEKIPVVTSVQVPSTQSRCVYVDNKKCMRMLMEYLIKLGHKRIAFVGGRNTVISTIEKRTEFLKAAQEHSITDARICEGDYGQEYGYITTKRLIHQEFSPTAIIAITDTCAIGVMRALNELGLVCPNDVSVVSFDNTYIAEMLDPELTSVSVDYDVLSRTMVNTLVNMIEKRAAEDVYELPVTFTIRESCTNIV